MSYPFIPATAGFLMLLFLLKMTFPYLAPFIIGFFFSLFLDAPVSFLEQRGWSRPFSTVIMTIIAFIGLPVLGLVFLFELWQETQSLLGIRWSRMLSERTIQFFEGLPLSTELDPASISHAIRTLFRWALAIPDLVLVWFVAALCTYLLCKDKRFFAETILKHLPRSWQKGFFLVYRDSVATLWQLLRIKLILVLATATLSTIVFWLLKIPYAVLLGILAGLMDLLPIVGPGLVYFGLIVSQILYRNFVLALALSLAYLLLLLVRQISEPHLVSEHLGLHPLTAVLGLYIGFKLWGILGVLGGPILLVIFKAFLALCATLI